MADSLQDQLRALGLARGKPKKRKRAKPAGRPDRHRSASAAKDEMSLDRAYALRDRDEKRQADRARRRKQAEDRKRREINQEIRVIVEAHGLNDANAELARNFLYRGRIRKIYVTGEQQKALNAAELGIAYLSGGYFILSSEHLEAVRAISAEHVVELSTGGEDEDEHPVPDDLEW